MVSRLAFECEGCAVQLLSPAVPNWSRCTSQSVASSSIGKVAQLKSRAKSIQSSLTFFDSVLFYFGELQLPPMTIGNR